MSDAFIHESSVVDDGAEVGEGSKVWHFCHVSGGARIGRDCVLGQNVFVGEGVMIGNGVHVQNNVSVYSGVTIGDDVFLGPSVAFTNVVRPRAGHPVGGLYEETRVGRGVTLGANATIVCGVSIGDFAFVGAGAVVTHDVPDYGLTVGNPARLIGWACECGRRLGFIGREPWAEAACECGLRFKLSAGRVARA